MTPSSPARALRREYRMPWRKRFQYLAAGAALIGASIALFQWGVPDALGLSPKIWGFAYIVIITAVRLKVEQNQLVGGIT